jgi:hydrogenase maturation factor
MVAIVAANTADAVVASLRRHGETASVVGTVVRDAEQRVVID